MFICHSIQYVPVGRMLVTGPYAERFCGFMPATFTTLEEQGWMAAEQAAQLAAADSNQ